MGIRNYVDPLGGNRGAYDYDGCSLPVVTLVASPRCEPLAVYRTGCFNDLNGPTQPAKRAICLRSIPPYSGESGRTVSWAWLLTSGPCNVGGRSRRIMTGYLRAGTGWTLMFALAASGTRLESGITAICQLKQISIRKLLQGSVWIIGRCACSYELTGSGAPDAPDPKLNNPDRKKSI